MAVAVVVVVVKKQFYEVGPKLLQQFFSLSLILLFEELISK